MLEKYIDRLIIPESNEAKTNKAASKKCRDPKTSYTGHKLSKIQWTETNKKHLIQRVHNDT